MQTHASGTRPPVDAATIQDALAAARVEVHYQPVVVLPSRHVVGFEALARLRHPDGRLVPPAEFIPVAEASGLIGAVGHRVLCRAVAEAARWRSAGGPLATATVSVNVAPAQLDDPTFVGEVLAVLADHHLPGSALVLEVTESAVASPCVREVIERLSGHGVRFAIDDFGTGFATLDSLRLVPAHMLKLDRTFVAGVTSTGADRAIVRVVIDLADSLGMSVVAEGIETEEQAQAVLGLGCVAMQGFLFARPGPDPEAAADLASRLPTPAERAEPQGVTGWSVALDEAVLSAARLLHRGDSAHRGAVHAVAVAAARAAGLDARAVLAVGRLALVHDLSRLAVDGCLPSSLRDERLAGLVERRPSYREGPGGSGPTELDLVAAAVRVVDGTVGAGLALDRDGLRAGLEAESAGITDPALSRLLRTVAATPPAVVAFDDLVEDLERRRMGRRGMEQRLRSVFGLTKVLGSDGDPRELMRVALEETRQLLGAASASVERWDRDTNRLRCLVNVGHLGPRGEIFPEDETYALADFAQFRRTMLTGRPDIAWIDAPNADPHGIELLQELGKCSSAAVPVHIDGRVWGQLWFSTDHGEPPFTTRDIETLMGVASLMGGVVVQAERLHRQDRWAFEDALTGVGNRRLVDDVLQRLSSAGEEVVLALLDLDDVRGINELQGYDAGDAAIRQVADALAGAVMTCPTATTGRFGGDLLCVVLPGVTLEEGGRLVGSAVEEVARAGGPSVSVGLAHTSGAWTPRQLLIAADEQLFAAKRGTRTDHPPARSRQRRARRDVQRPTPH